MGIAVGASGRTWENRMPTLVEGTTGGIGGLGANSPGIDSDLVDGACTVGAETVLKTGRKGALGAWGRPEAWVVKSA